MAVTIQNIVDELTDELELKGRVDTRVLKAALSEIRKRADHQDLMINHLAIRPTRVIRLAASPLEPSLADA